MFAAAFLLLAIVCLAVYFCSNILDSEKASNKELLRLQRTYLNAYLLAAAGDWLQGPHVYALYESYNLSKHDIECLFAVGFSSSLVVGTFVGSIADTLGRKLNCILYGAMYAMSCVTKHFSNFGILLVGRLLGGIATSILCTSFEAWLVHENFKLSLDEFHLKILFSKAVLLNCVVAISSGIVAHVAASVAGLTGPFDVAFFVLIVMVMVIAFTWEENYGNKQSNMKESLVEAVKAIKSDWKIALLGVVQALFEASMYTFVLEWTPVLNHATQPTNSINEVDKLTLPHGLIFACFMLAIMIGSCIFSLLSRHRLRPESFLRFVLATSAFALTIPVLLSAPLMVTFVGFLVFEMCVGIFWPACAYMRGIYVPEKERSTVMNLFRIPLNTVVIVILLCDLQVRWIFVGCFAFLASAAIAQQILWKKVSSIQPNCSACSA